MSLRWIGVGTTCENISIGTTALFTEVDWRVVVSASLLAGLLSLLTSVGGLPELEE